MKRNKQTAFPWYLLKVTTFKHKLNFLLPPLLSLSPRLFFFFLPSQYMTWPVQPRPRLNCAISYVFTLLASFCAYFRLNISPHIILHFLYNDMPSLISLCEPIPGPEDQNTITMLESFFLIWPILWSISLHMPQHSCWKLIRGLKKKKVAPLINI